MKTLIKYTIYILIVLISCNLSFAQTKLAQTGMKFLGISMGAKESGMADAMTAVEEPGAASMFYNPAGMARMDRLTSASLGNVKWIAEINYMYGALAFRPFDGNYGVLGFNFQYADYGDFIGTIYAENTQGFIETGTFKPKAWAFGVGYAKELSDKFSVGGNVKWANQNLGSAWIKYDIKVDTTTKDTTRTPVEESYNKGIMAFDFGVLYKTGFKSLTFGMCVRNFSTEVKFIKEDFQLPLVLKIGLSMDMVDLTNFNKDMYSFNLAVEAIHHRDYPEQLNIGGEFLFMKMLALRFGYSTPNDERNWTLGAGVGKEFPGFKVNLDYSYVPFGRFDPVHRFGLSFSF